MEIPARSDENVGRVFLRQCTECALIFVPALVLAIGLQIAANAYAGDIREDDEPGHYVTGLMFHDYLASMHFGNPFHFAENYYLHYPQVAIGHWPPVFYIVQAAWGLVFPTSRGSVLVLLAILGASISLTIYLLARSQYSMLPSATFALLFLVIPAVEQHVVVVKTELLLTLFSLWSTILFAGLIDRPSMKLAAGFGVCVSLAILTKGNGWALVLIPPIALLAIGRLRFLVSRYMWVAAGVIAMLSLPWQLFTLRFPQTPTIEVKMFNCFACHAFPYNVLSLVRNFSLPLIAFAVVGVAIKLYKSDDGIHGALWCSLAGLLVGTVGFHSLVAIGLAPRYLMAAYPAVLLFGLAGAQWLFTKISVPAPAMVASLLSIASFFALAFVPPVKAESQFRETAKLVMGRLVNQGGVVLVSSEGPHEQIFVAECAMFDDRRPNRYIVRASKIFSTSDWTGGKYNLLYKAPAEMMTALERLAPDVVVLDLSHDSRLPSLHHQMLRSTVQQYPDRFHLLATQGSGESRVEILALTGLPPVRLHRIDVDLNAMLGIRIHGTADERTGENTPWSVR